MKRVWLQPSVLVLLALVVVIGASSLDDSRGERTLVRKSGDCSSGICRRNFKDDTSKITERDDLDELTNSYKDDDGRQKRRCMSYSCRLRRRLLTDEIYNNDDNDGIYDDKRSTNINGLSSIDDTTIEDKRSTRTKEGLTSNDRAIEEKRTRKKNDKSSKRCMSWFCNDYGKRAKENLEKKREIKSDEKGCMSWKCIGKRLKERMDHINKQSKRKIVKNFDSMTKKRFPTVLKKQGDGRTKICLSWDCKREMALKDSTSEKREPNDDRGFKRFLMRKNFADVDTDEYRPDEEK